MLYFIVFFYIILCYFI